MTPRRLLTLTVLLCALGAVLVLLAAGRVWIEEVAPRPGPLPDVRTETTGGQLRPWLPALGWVALAGAGALLATRAALRQGLGGLLAVLGAAVAAGAVASAADPQVVALPPVAAAAGGVAVAAAGGLTLWRGRSWPSMGARYERGPARRREPTRAPGAGSGAGEGAPAVPTRTEELWDALDQGEDPTAR